KTPYECHDVYLGLKKPKKGKWSTAEDALLLQTFTKLSQEFPNDLSLTFWNKVATQMMVLRTGSQCMARYQETLDPTLKRGKWSEDEVELLLKLYQTHGKAWVKISEQIPGRTQRQCRARWIMTQK
ncbi:Homeodomain-like protein, partial [Gorgonomyces haynaldii]